MSVTKMKQISHNFWGASLSENLPYFESWDIEAGAASQHSFDLVVSNVLFLLLNSKERLIGKP